MTGSLRRAHAGRSPGLATSGRATTSAAVAVTSTDASSPTSGESRANSVVTTTTAVARSQTERGAATTPAIAGSTHTRWWVHVIGATRHESSPTVASASGGDVVAAVRAHHSPAAPTRAHAATATAVGAPRCTSWPSSDRLCAAAMSPTRLVCQAVAVQ